jgi:hypothetical protein
VKTFRLWLMLLLAVLLPVRGAVAAGMLCPASGFGFQTETPLTKQAYGHHASKAGQGHPHHEVEAHEHGAGHDGKTVEAPDPAGSNADKCDTCSSFCSVMGLLSAGVTVAASQPASTVFPHPVARPASFVPDGQERPPRAI